MKTVSLLTTIRSGWLVPLALALQVCLLPPALGQVEEDRTGKVDDYNQWKQALGSASATDPATLRALPGYRVELLRSAQPGEGSWISLAFDPAGRLTVGREGPGILRMILPERDGDEIRVETINDALLECRGLLYAFDSLYVNANNSKGFYRLRDTTGDDRFDQVELLRATGGGVGHGRNGLVLGPDGMLYLIHGNDTLLPDGYQAGRSPLRNYGQDKLLPCDWNRFLFNAGVKAPAGHVVRTDRDGKTWEIVAGGFRNPYGIDFNPDGEMFTFDADMEWDVGAPWYRPCRVNHVVSGGDYGWRQGTDKWPAWYPDSLPSSLDVGLASPTGVKFGTHSRFPTRYRQALFILDWAYGRILAVHLKPAGASYACRAETFLKGRPLNVTDLAFGPDGAMYVVTGGRGTQSGLYRVTYAGSEQERTETPEDAASRSDDAAAARALRRQLESFHGRQHPEAVDAAWPHLGSSDPWLRHAARVAVEHQSLAAWRDRALAESDTSTAATALLALARAGEPSDRAALLARLCRMPLAELGEAEKLAALRAYELAFVRLGEEKSAPQRARIAAQLDALYPDASAPVNRELAELLVYLEAPSVIEKSLALLQTPVPQEEKLHLLFTLRHVKSGWTPPARRSYFRFLQQAQHFAGARSMPVFIEHIRKDALAALSEEERPEYEALLAAAAAPPAAPAGPSRPLVRHWKLDDLAGSLEEADRGRSFERGKAMFAAATCSGCHQVRGEGKALGPDLTSVASRFGRRDLLEAILSPSKAIDEKYRNVVIATADGRVIVGGIAGGDERTLIIATNPLDPSEQVAVKRDEIEQQQFSLVSPMPPGTLDTLSKEEILDLLSYLESGGDPHHDRFKRK